MRGFCGADTEELRSHARPLKNRASEAEDHRIPDPLKDIATGGGVLLTAGTICDTSAPSLQDTLRTLLPAAEDGEST